MSAILVTGCAGFIGFHLCRRLLSEGWSITGIDSLNDYYDPQLKRDRLNQLTPFPEFTFLEITLEDRNAVEKLIQPDRLDAVVHLAAQAGVRYSIENPQAYIDANVTGFLNVLEAARKAGLRHLLYASSSSVYGSNRSVPYSVDDRTDHPVSLYAATKKAGELFAHSYSHLYGLPTTGLRLFTVYGPWGRPDMAYFKFTKSMLAGEPIEIYNHGRMKRDFTYIDDIVEGIVRLLHRPPRPQPAYDMFHPLPGSSYAPYKVYNIGNNKPVPLLEFVETLERVLGVEALKVWKPLQPGDVIETYADISDLTADTGYLPTTGIETGLARFADWYKSYYGA